MSELTHFDADGKAHMVDVADKAITKRMARAEGSISMSQDAFRALKSGSAQKGDVLGVARIAGIMAAKKTAEIIPLCHPLPLTKIAIEFELEAQDCTLRAIAMVQTEGKTGVEMEALMAVSSTLLTIYDMLKSIDKSMLISDIRLREKIGGKSGDFKAP